MNEIKNIFKKIQNEKIGELNFEQESNKGRYYSKQIDNYFQRLIQDSKSGKKIKVDELKELFDKELLIIKSKYKNRPNPKMINLYDTVKSSYRNLDKLNFEIAKSKEGIDVKLCYCSLRLSNSIRPDYSYLKEYGRAILYDENDEFIIYECNLCKLKWINATVPGMLSYGHSWTKWNSNGDYLLRDIFEK